MQYHRLLLRCESSKDEKASGMKFGTLSSILFVVRLEFESLAGDGRHKSTSKHHIGLRALEQMSDILN